METITKEEAIKQGYWLCGNSKNTDWQHLLPIEDLTDEEIAKGELVLADTKSESPTTDADWIKELIADAMESNWGNDTGDDTEQVFNAIDKLDFTQTAEMVNKALENIKSYKLTDIKITN